jgi:hypothetical protein
MRLFSSLIQLPRLSLLSARILRREIAVIVAMLSLMMVGCGKTIQQSATDQLLLSDAVDRAVAVIDFTPLQGYRVYFDDRFIKNIKGNGFVNSEYIISSLRQQLSASGCYITEKIETAQLVVEPRVGALGADQYEMIYGIPSNNFLSSASSIIPASPTIPTMPELSFAKKRNQMGAAKIGIYAYEKESREIVWQSGISNGRSKAKESFVLGAGPLQSGTIYEGQRFAGNRFRSSTSGDAAIDQANQFAKTNPYFKDKTYDVNLASHPPVPESNVPGKVQLTGHNLPHASAPAFPKESSEAEAVTKPSTGDSESTGVNSEGTAATPSEL